MKATQIVQGQYRSWNEKDEKGRESAVQESTL